MHRLKLRAQKRNRQMVECMDAFDNEVYYALSPIGSGGHAPNAFESKCIRKMRARFGVTEDELRNDRRYRKMLGAALRSNQKVSDPMEKSYKRVMRALRALTSAPWTKEYKEAFCLKWESFGLFCMEQSEIAYNNLATKRGWIIDATRNTQTAKKP